MYQPSKNGVFTERLMNGYFKEWTFVNNQKQGKWKACFKNGQVEEMGYYHLGKPEGEYRSYWGNGKTQQSWIYKNGRRTGLSRHYSKEGYLLLEGNYLNDKQVGKWISYNEKGEFLSIKDYGEKGEPLCFKDIDGKGNFTCRDCGYKGKITCHLHGVDGVTGKILGIDGYQCQLCGKFQTRKSTFRETEIDLTCECGGKIDREKPLFCPKCKGLDVEYHCTFGT